MSLQKELAYLRKNSAKMLEEHRQILKKFGVTLEVVNSDSDELVATFIPRNTRSQEQKTEQPQTTSVREETDEEDSLGFICLTPLLTPENQSKDSSGN